MGHVALKPGETPHTINLATLQATFRDRHYTFKHVPESKVEFMRWQAGRETVDCVTMPNGDVRLLEKFELLCWAEDAGKLIEKLACKD